MNMTLSKWDAITWTLVLAIVPYGWTVVGAMLMCWMVMQLDNRKDRKKPTPGGPITYVDGGGNTTTYGDISGGTYQKGVRTESNRSVWKDFFDNDDF
jgi:hypothetical protein